MKFRPPASTSCVKSGYMNALWQKIKRISDSFNRHHGPLLAAAVAFYGLLSLVPLLSLGVALLAELAGGSETALNTLQNVLAQIVPGNQEVVYKTVSDLKHGSGLAGLIGLGGLLISASAVFSTLEEALNGIWHAPAHRVWWKQKLVAIGTALSTIVLMFCSLAITSALAWLKNRVVPGTETRVSDIPFVWQLVGAAVPLLLSISTFTLIYKIIPNRPIAWMRALIGGLFAGTAWEIAKYLFAVYLAKFAQYSKVYGSLAAIVSLMIWAYYSSTILLIGGEVMADRADDS